MRFKMGLVVGFGIGYVFGARAGRERYEELKNSWESLRADPRVRDVLDRGKHLAEEGASRGLQAVREGIERASSSVRDRLGDGEGPNVG